MRDRVVLRVGDNELLEVLLEDAEVDVVGEEALIVVAVGVVGRRVRAKPVLQEARLRAVLCTLDVARAREPLTQQVLPAVRCGLLKAYQSVRL